MFMMMAFDRSPPDPRLDPETVEALRVALTRSVSRGSHADDLHTLLCRAAAEARTKGMLAERLLLILKDIWYSLPEVSSASNSAIRGTLLQELISRCIQE